MRASRVLLILGIVVVVAAGLALSGRVGVEMGAPKAGAAELGEDVRRPKNVEVAAVRMGSIESILSYPGDVQPRHEVAVLPKVSGRIEQLLVGVGDRVSKGQVIARLDDDTLRVQVAQARAALAAAEAKLAQMKEGPREEQVRAAEAAVVAARARAERVALPPNENEITMAKAKEAQARAALEQAQAAYDAIAWFDGKGMLPQSLALQQATIAYEAARAGYEEALAGAKAEDIRAAEAQVWQAQAQLDLARNPYRETDFKAAEAAVAQAQAAVDLAVLQLAEAVVKAPVDGLVSEAPLTTGSMVGPATPIVTLISPDVEVTVRVEESRIGEVRKGQPSRIAVSAFPGKRFGGTVSLISPVADAEDRTFEVKITPDRRYEELRGGMFAEVNLVTEQHANALLVPRAAVIEENGRTSVFVLKNGEAEKREVELGLTQGDTVQVISGLVLGEQVVVAGQAGLQPGDPVEVVAG